MAENLVIGGGVYGTGVALEIAKSGRGVRLLEKQKIASGASGGPGRRGVRANGRDVRELPLMKMAYDIWPELHNDFDTNPFFERTGNLLLIEREQDLKSAPARVWLQQQQGIPSEFLSCDELREMEPELDQRVKAAIFCEKDGVCDHAAVTKAFEKKSREFGAQIDENSVAVSLEIKNGRVKEVITNMEEHIQVTGTLFVLSNSTVSDLIENHCGFHLPVWNECLQVLITEPIDNFFLKRLVGHAHRTISLKAENENRVMITGGWHGLWDESLCKGKIIQSSVDGNMAEAICLYPALENAIVSLVDCNHLETMSIDNVPIIDRIPGTSNAFFATGWSGHGWAIAPPIIHMLVEWEYTGKKPVLLQPFGLERFMRFKS